MNRTNYSDSARDNGTTDAAPKVALVTGGAVRVGRAISKALHKEGYNVVVHCNRSIEAAKSLEASLNRYCVEIRAYRIIIARLLLFKKRDFPGASSYNLLASLCRSCSPID